MRFDEVSCWKRERGTAMISNLPFQLPSDKGGDGGDGGDSAADEAFICRLV